MARLYPYKLKFLETQNDLLFSVNENIYECRTELRNKQHMADKMTLKSPVTGYILSSDAGYAGETVSGGQKLFVIVPGDSEYIFQGYLSDRYIADVEVGDTAQIKLQAYSYSDYEPVLGNLNNSLKEK
ncbi:MAG: HlyD family efflux transporter periplasmic adaptor subunit [Butyrivibrio sp.]